MTILNHETGTDQLLVEVADSVATVTFNNPARRNALTAQMRDGGSARRDDGADARTSDGDVVLKMPRGAQVIYPKDLGPILMLADVFPGARILGGDLATLCLESADDAGIPQRIHLVTSAVE